MAPQSPPSTSASKLPFTLRPLLCSNLGRYPAFPAQAEMQFCAHQQTSAFPNSRASTPISLARAAIQSCQSSPLPEHARPHFFRSKGIPSGGSTILPKVMYFGNWLLQATPPSFVGFRFAMTRRMVGMSSSGGGLFGRPVILTNPGRFLFCGSTRVIGFPHPRKIPKRSATEVTFLASDHALRSSARNCGSIFPPLITATLYAVGGNSPE